MTIKPQRGECSTWREPPEPLATRRPLLVLRSVQLFVAGPEAPGLESPHEDREEGQGRQREHDPPLDGPRAGLLLPRVVLARRLLPFLDDLVLFFLEAARQGGAWIAGLLEAI